MRGVAWVAWFMMILSGAVLLVSCLAFVGTPMHGKCRYLPSVQECQDAANHYIEDECLLDCIRHLCVVGRPKCDADEDIPNYCTTHKPAPGKDVGGYVPEPLLYEVRSCTEPTENIDWCQLPLSPPCQSSNMVHELAHACGWHHNEGKGVPNNDGRTRCK